MDTEKPDSKRELSKLKNWDKRERLVRSKK